MWDDMKHFFLTGFAWGAGFFAGIYIAAIILSSLYDMVPLWTS